MGKSIRTIITLVLLLCLTSCTISPGGSANPTGESPPEETLGNAVPSSADTPQVNPPIPTITDTPSETVDDGFIRIPVDYPSIIPYDESVFPAALKDTLKTINLFSMEENLIANQGAVRISALNLLFFNPKRLDEEETQKYVDDYKLLYEEFISVSELDACFSSIFTADATNIEPSYKHDGNILEGGTVVGVNPVGVEESPVMILVGWESDGAQIILSMKQLTASPAGDLLDANKNIVGKEEDGNYIIEREAFEALNTLKYTCRKEGETYKIHSMDITDG